MPTPYAASGWRCHAPTRRSSGAAGSSRCASSSTSRSPATRPRWGSATRRIARDSLIASDPETFFLPPTSDLRYQWVCARLARLDETETRELVTDAWRMCVPQMLHDLPDQPQPVAAAWWAMDEQRWDDLGRCCIPTCTGRTAGGELRGRSQVLDHLRGSPTPRPPADVEIRDGQVYRWTA